MFQSLSKLSTAIAALGVLTSCLLIAPAAEASQGTTHARGKAHARGRLVSPKQAFKRIATRRPDRLVRKHVGSVIRTARTTHHGPGGEAAIQTVSTVTVEADLHASPSLEPIGVLIAEYARFKTHDGLARRSPRGPPAFS